MNNYDLLNELEKKGLLKELTQRGLLPNNYSFYKQVIASYNIEIKKDRCKMKSMERVAKLHGISVETVRSIRRRLL